MRHKKTNKTILWGAHLFLGVIISFGCFHSSSIFIKYDFEYNYHSGYRFTYPVDSMVVTMKGRVFTYKKFYIDTTKFKDRNENIIKIKNDKKNLYYVYNKSSNIKPRVKKRFPLIYGDTIFVPPLLGWGLDSYNGKSNLKNIDTTLLINGTLRSFYHFTEYSKEYFNGIITSNNDQVFIDKELLMPLKFIRIRLNNKDNFIDTVIVSGHVRINKNR